MIDRLPLSDMADRHRGLTPPMAGLFCEAAGVCLARHHLSPAEFNIRNESTNTQAVAEWPEPDELTRAAYANRTDTTEWGAYGCAIAAVELTERLCVIGRAETMTGADFYVAGSETSREDMENWLRLEVSGMDKGTQAALKHLLFRKINQAKAGASNLPAIAAVVCFESLSILVERAAKNELEH